MPWLMRIFGGYLVRAAWRLLRSRRLWGAALAAVPLVGTSDAAAEHAPGFAEAVGIALSRFAVSLALAAVLLAALWALWRRWTAGPTLYERVNAEALGISVEQLREVWAVERSIALAQAAEPWSDDRIRHGRTM